MSDTLPASDRPVRIAIRNLYKIFGPDPSKALDCVRKGIGKQELLQEHGHVLGLEDINIDIRAGEITVIMGLSGSGKSTLIRHLNRLIEPTSGVIELGGHDIRNLGPEALRRLRQTEMSMVFQRFALLPHKTVLENAEMPLRVKGTSPDVSHREAMHWLDRVGLAGFESRYPRQLSGGMQQRVGLARALSSGSDIMLMDEAFSALDPIIRIDMQTLLLELQSELNKTIVFITHDLDEALRLADQIVVLKDGKIVQKGEPQLVVLKPADEYIENFVRDVNRARVLRARSIMTPAKGNLRKQDGLFTLDKDSTLNAAIILGGGRTDARFQVAENGAVTGTFTMADLLKAIAGPAKREPTGGG